MEQPIARSSLSQNDGARYDAFISYHWRDRAHVEDLARALRDRHLNVFLDRWYLRPGRPWPQELEAVLRDCRAVLVCVGAGEMGPWQQREKCMALERQESEPGFPVIPVLLQGAEPALGFLGQNTWIDLRAAPSAPALIEILAAAIQGEPPGPEARGRVAQTLATVCPYRGLLYFREEDAPFFFGREAAIAGLIEAVQLGPLIAVVGASGSGKSSVVRAGLVPALRRDGARVWDAVTIVPGARPLHALAAGFLPLLEPDMSETDRLIEVNKLAGALETGTVHLPEIAARIVEKQAGTDRLLLIVDQWEELYTLKPDDAIRRRVVDELLAATEASPLTVVLTLRGDFVGHVLAYRPLADRLQGAQVNLGPMVREELRRAIEQPAVKVGLRFEAGLVDRILDDAGDEPGNLPLLEFVLRQLWERRQHGELRHDAYEDLGRLPGAVAKKAEDVFERLSALEQQVVQRVFLRLATPTEEGDYARRRAARSELGEGVLEVVRKLADERLLVTAPGPVGAEDTVEVSHEALLRRWERLKVWLDGHREFLLWRRRFAELVTTWRAGGKREDALATGVFLGEAERWQEEQSEQLTPEEQEYTVASANRRLRETEAEQTRVARLESEIGERRRAQAEAERASRVKSEFLANMSHELRTPLNGIIGFSELMHDGKVGPVSAEHQEYLGDILASARHLRQLINDVLDLSKLESGKMDFRPEPIVLARLVGEVRDILRTLAANKRIEVEVAIDPDLADVIADPAKLKQVLYNYLSNALKFTPDGGQVSIRAIAHGADAVRFEVEDTGVGIRSEDLPRLFVEFQQIDLGLANRYGGMGLGLALTKRIVEAQGGKVGVRSTLGRGSLFFAILPRVTTSRDDES